jgi:hypothetical protein
MMYERVLLSISVEIPNAKTTIEYGLVQVSNAKSKVVDSQVWNNTLIRLGVGYAGNRFGESNEEEQQQQQQQTWQVARSTYSWQ